MEMEGEGGAEGGRVVVGREGERVKWLGGERERWLSQIKKQHCDAIACWPSCWICLGLKALPGARHHLLGHGGGGGVATRHRRRGGGGGAALRHHSLPGSVAAPAASSSRCTAPRVLRFEVVRPGDYE